MKKVSLEVPSYENCFQKKEYKCKDIFWWHQMAEKQHLI